MHKLDEKDQIAFLRAAREGDIATVEALLAAGVDVEARNEHGATALVFAAQGGHAATVEMLMTKGADVNAKDKFDRTALMYAQEKGHTEIAALLELAEAGKWNVGDKTPAGNNQNPAQQVQVLVRHVQKEILMPFWQRMEQITSRYDRELQAAEYILANVREQIERYEGETTHLFERFKKLQKYNSLQKAEMLKNKLRTQVSGVTDLRKEIKSAVQKVQERNKVCKRANSDGKGCGCAAIVFLSFLGGTLISFITSIILAIDIASLILPFSIVFLGIGYVIKKLDNAIGSMIENKYHRAAAWAELLVERWQEVAENEYQRACAEAESRVEQERQKTKKLFSPRLIEAVQRVRQFKARDDFPEVAWQHQCWQNWNPATTPAMAVRFGVITPDTSWRPKEKK